VLLKEVIRNKDVYTLCYDWFGVTLTEKQKVIVRTIGFAESQYFVISCMTRYGKSFCVALGVLIYIFLHPNKRILIISPLIDQSRIIRNYISEFIVICQDFRSLIDMQLSGIEKLKSEVSKKRITFTNGCELTILSAEGTAERLMGFGGDLIIRDEDGLIAYAVYRSRISRMLGDNPDAMTVSIGNPWNKNNQMWEAWINPKFDKVHVDYKVAIKEGRITKQFVEEQRQLLTPIEFKVLYEAEFPDEAEDSLFQYQSVKDATKSIIEIDPKKAKKIISCDVADKGTHRTVIMWGYEQDGLYYIEDIWMENKSDNMHIVGKILSIYRDFGAHLINVDTIGVGAGVISRLREKIGDETTIKACHFGESTGASGSERYSSASERLEDKKSESSRKRFVNKKAEQYFRLKELFEDHRISIPKDHRLIEELMKMRFDFTSGEKFKIIDPKDKSPDFADALVYFIWKTQNEIYLDFGKNENTRIV